MEVTNNLPEFFIVSDTKLNPQTIERFLKETGRTELLHHWNEKNKNDNVSSIEQHFELLARIYGLVQGEKTNEESLKEIVSNPALQYIFDHGQITVLFKNVSLNFMMLLLRLKIESLNMINEKLSLEEMGFWLPPILDQPENKEVALNFAATYSITSQKINELLDKIGYVQIIKEHPEAAEPIRQLFTRLMPISSQVNLGLSCTVRGWRQLILMGSNFASDDELRYVFMHLAKDFKKRYYGLFQDFSLENASGNKFGLDSLRDEKAWHNYQVVKN